MNKHWLLVISILFAGAVRADPTGRLTHIRVNRAFRIGNFVVEPGSYDLRVRSSGSSRTIFQLFNSSGRLVFTKLGIPSYRLAPAGRTEFVFREAAGEELQSLRAWFSPGENSGLEFPAVGPEKHRAPEPQVTARKQGVPPPAVSAPVPARVVTRTLSPDGNQVPRWGQRPEPASILSYPDKWALVIGVGRTLDPAADLKIASKDAHDVASMLASPFAGRFPPGHVRLLVDDEATRARILAEIANIGARAKPDDLVLVYVSGHGFVNIANQKRYLATHDVVPSDLDDTAFEMSEFGRILGARVRAQVLGILDACESGAAENYPKGLALEPNVVLMTSSRADEESWVSVHLQNSYFTRYFVDTMWSTNGTLPLREIYRQLSVSLPPAVLAATGSSQHPQMLSDNRGDEIVIGAPVK